MGGIPIAKSIGTEYANAMSAYLLAIDLVNQRQAMLDEANATLVDAKNRLTIAASANPGLVDIEMVPDSAP